MCPLDSNLLKQNDPQLKTKLTQPETQPKTSWLNSHRNHRHSLFSCVKHQNCNRCPMFLPSAYPVGHAFSLTKAEFASGYQRMKVNVGQEHVQAAPLPCVCMSCMAQAPFHGTQTECNPRSMCTRTCMPEITPQSGNSTSRLLAWLSFTQDAPNETRVHIPAGTQMR